MSKLKITPSRPLTEFGLYSNSTGQIPQIVVNLVRVDKYIESINRFRKILSVEENRKNNILIEFQVRSSDNKGSPDITSFPTFYMRCSDLYVVGYKHEGSIMIFSDGDLDYSPEIREYNFNCIYTSSNVRTSSLHAIGYTVAEAVRFPYVEKKISKLIEKKNYILDIDANLFDMGLLHSVDDTELNKIIEEINNIIIKFTVYEITHGNWGFVKENGIKTKISKLFKKLDTYFSKFNEGAKEIAAISSTVISEANEAASEAKYFEELLGYEEDEESEDSDLGEIDGINLNERLEEIEKKLDSLHEILEQKEDGQEDAQLWEDITEAQCEWSRISAIQKLALLSKNIELIEEIFSHLSIVVNGMYEDAKIAIKPGNVTSIEFLGGVYNQVKENHCSISSGELPTYSSLSYNDSPDDDNGGGAISINRSSKKNEASLVTETLLSYHLSWLKNLPQWLQDQILNSTPIKTLIDSIKYNSAIYGPTLVTEGFYEKVLYIEQDKSQNYISEDVISGKVQVDDTDSSANMIDMTMILSGAAVSYLILPTIAASVQSSLKYNMLGGGDGFNLFNSIEIV